MFAGVSTACYYPELTENAFEHLLDNNVKAVEIFVNSNTEVQKDYLTELQKKADNAGAKVTSIHPFTSRSETYWFFSEYERRFVEGREYFKRFYDAANYVGANSIVLHGDSLYREVITQDTFLERFGLMYRDALESGVNLCLENVNFFRSQNPSLYPTIIENFPKAQFVLDIKQTKVAGIDVYEYLKTMAGHIHHVHFSDNTAEETCLPPGKGTFDIDKFLFALEKTGFDGALIIELYRHNFGEYSELIDSYNFLNRKLKNYKLAKTLNKKRSAV